MSQPQGRRRPKLTQEQVAEYFRSEGCELLNRHYLGTKQPLRYRCKCGKIGYTCFNNFSRGHRCIRCYLEQVGAGRQAARIRLRSEMLTMADVARMLGVTYADLWTHVRIKKTLPPPTHNIGRVRHYYAPDDVARLRSLIVPS